MKKILILFSVIGLLVFSSGSSMYPVQPPGQPAISQISLPFTSTAMPAMIAPAALSNDVIQLIEPESLFCSLNQTREHDATFSVLTATSSLFPSVGRCRYSTLTPVPTMVMKKPIPAALVINC